MKRTYAMEPVYQLAALLIAVIVVHAAYVVWIRPRADEELRRQAEQMRVDPNYVQERSLFVIVRDFEQEACFVLMLWASTMIAMKSSILRKDQRLLRVDLIPRAEGTRILPADAREYARRLESLPEGQRASLLPRTLLAALYRFSATGRIQDVSETTRALCAAESDRLDSELSMLRYIAWAIPSIGFIGTVRGIGEALGQAHQAVAGDIAGVTQSLGVAFNSTFIALLISIVLMFMLHQLQLTQERFVLDAETYLDQHLIQHMRVA